MTERLILTQLTQADAQQIFMLRSDEEINKFIDRAKATSIDDAIRFIDKIKGVIAGGEGMFWAIHLKHEPGLIGTICYWNILAEKQRAEIGYELLTAFQGKGIMQEALQSVLKFGFENLAFQMITAFTRYDHRNSIRLLERNNFKRNSVLEQEIAHDLNNHIIYALERPA